MKRETLDTYPPRPRKQERPRPGTISNLDSIFPARRTDSHSLRSPDWDRTNKPCPCQYRPFAHEDVVHVSSTARSQAGAEDTLLGGAGLKGLPLEARL